MSQYRRRSEVETLSKEYRAVVERYEAQADQCTIYPADTEQDKEVTKWITAEAPAYVHLVDHR